MISGLVALGVQMMVAGGGLRVQEVADGVVRPMTSVVVTAKKEKVVNYDISVRGAVRGDVEEFRRIVAETFADGRGWGRAGVKFVEVASGGAMHVVLASGAEVRAASSGCSDVLSCRVGSLVLINDTRWMEGSDSYNALGLPLAEYRRMVVNHEVGHYLGHGHIESCETGTGLAPVMLQQSTGLRGCGANAWPLPGELWWR